MHNTKLAVILSERGPERLSVRGGESKNLRLFFDELQTHHDGRALKTSTASPP